MKTVVAMVLGGLIVIALFLGMISSNSLVLTSNNLLRTPKTNVVNDNSNSSVSLNYLDNHQQVPSTDISEGDINKFSKLLSGEGTLIGNVSNGATVVIPLADGIIKNNQFVVPEYYTSLPWEHFTDYIAADGNNKYTINEYYNGVHTGIFNVTESANNKLVGSFEHVSNQEMANVSMQIESSRNVGKLENKPFYIGVIGQTAVTLVNTFNGKYVEYYHGDEKVFNVEKVQNNSSNNYDVELEESYNGKVTGEYLLNDVGNDTYTGVFIKAPNSQNPVKSTVGLTGSNSPTTI
ncbi:MAG: hypothetical protein ACRC41_10260 [Sarcina sp.]